MKKEKIFEGRPHTIIILREMLNRVGADFDNFNFNKKEWYKKYSWTEEEQDDFKKWAISYLYNNKGARDEILSINIKNKKFINNAMNWFIFNYGWPIKNTGDKKCYRQK